MRKADDGGGGSGRLSSSCSSIRSSNYQRSSYTPSFNTFKYSPANYTPNISRNQSSTSSAVAADPVASRVSRYSSTVTPSSSNLSRITSTSHKTLYSSPAAARVSVSTNDSLSKAPTSLAPINAYRGISKYSTIERSTESKPYYSSLTSSVSSNTYDRGRSRSERNSISSSSTLADVKIESGPTTRTMMVHPTSAHIRSRSSLSSRNATAQVQKFAEQGRERESREKKDREYNEWKQREAEKKEDFESLLPTLSTSSTSSSNAQNEFRKSVATTSTGSLYRSRYSSNTRVTPSTASSSSFPAQHDDVMTSSYSSVTATTPSAYPPFSTSTSTPLHNGRVRVGEEKSRISLTPQPQQQAPPPPPPPPPPPTRGQYLPRSVSAAVITGSSTSSLTRPTVKTNQYDDGRNQAGVEPGYTGLRNPGNNCFMNAVLQMLVNNVELREFFLNDHFKNEINTSNPLGSEGRLANAFADFMHQMWSGRYSTIEPIEIKNIVAEKASQFANNLQQDAHEFLSFLLDGLHEDVNRVKTKPLTNTVESHGRHDLEVSKEAWKNHVLRNDSIFVDLFHGQLKSHVQCPTCDRVSITFDPFVYLPVPFPKRKKSTSLVFWPIENQAKPFKMTVSYSTEGTVADFLSAVSEAVRVPSRNLRACEALCHRFDKMYTPDMKASDIIYPDYLFVFQVHDEAECNEEVVVLNVVQRELYRKGLKYVCHECGTTQGKLKACEECYDAFYCSKKCQVDNWSTGGHRESCSKRPTSDLVGFPLIISLPRSQLTYQQLYRVLDAKSKHTVQISQPVQNDVVDGGESSESSSSKKRNGVGAPPGFLQPPGDLSSSSSSVSSTPRRRSFAVEKKTTRMFEIRKLVTQNDSFGSNTIGDDEACQALESGGFISINWMNQRNGRSYISVENQSEINLDVEKSNQMSSKKLNNVSNNCDTNPHLTQMLGLFSETERLKPEESWYCSACKAHVEATKRLQLYRLPPVLIIQLKRFVYTAFPNPTSTHRRSKDDRTVEYPLDSLDMSPFLADTAPNQNSTMYDLTGVVCHSGSSYCGHYVSVGRLADFDSAKTKIEWRQFDDWTVTKQSPAKIQTNNAYLLFYKLRDPSVTRSIFKRHYSCDPGNQQSAAEDIKI